MEIYPAKLGYDKIQTVSLVQPGNLLLEPEMLEDLAGFTRESFDVVGQVGSNILRITLKFLKTELAGVMKVLASHFV